MPTRTVVPVLLIVALLSTSVAVADRLIPFQARLTDAAGAPVTDGVYSITFAIYDVELGGTALISETHPTVSVIGGQVNVLLGSIADLDPLDFTAPRYLGITVGMGQEMVPRHELIPAFHARTAEVADSVQDGAIGPPAIAAGFGLVPSGTVIFFDGTVCPTGWTEQAAARGRTIVGLPAGGLLGGQNTTTPFFDRENRGHLHSISARSISGTINSDTHNHRWMRVLDEDASGRTWSTFDVLGNRGAGVNWALGLDTGGDGWEAFMQSQPVTPGAYYTDNDTHIHGFSLVAPATSTASTFGQVPTIQYLVCRKN